MAIRTERVEFDGAHGLKLAARLDRPVDEPRAFALFAHCFTCSKDVFAASRIALALAAQGIAVLRFDFTGLGHSEGEFANTNFSSNIADLAAAAEFLARRYVAPEILVGHSLGGSAVIAAAPRLPSVKAVATINAPADPAHVAHLFTGAAEKIAAEGEAEVRIAGRGFRIRKQFLDDIAEHRLESALGSLGKALLVFHAPRDAVVGIDNAARIFAAAKHPKSFVSLDGADHLLTNRDDAAYVGTVLAAWASRYLSAPAPATAAESAMGEVVVAETGAGRFAQTIQASGHRLSADEPVSVGGMDSGPTPYDLLLAALGACTGMTLRLYAERKGWSMGPITVRLAHHKIHAADCADCETREGKIDHITRSIELAEPVDAARREALLRIADRCPVHRTLMSEVRVETGLAGS